MLSKLIHDYSKNYYNYKIKDFRFSCQRNKYWILKNFISLECFFDNLIDSGMSKSYCIDQHSKFIYTQNKIFIYLKNYNSLNHETFNNNFISFRIECIVFFRLSSLYLYETKSYKNKYHKKFYQFVIDLIKKFKLIFFKGVKENEKLPKNYLFLKIIIIKLKEIKNILEMVMKINVIDEHNQIFDQVLLSELNFQVKMYEVLHINDTSYTKKN
ncbi:hypothetical protein NUSPORA_01162 [Nucleospora cyclopteri]